jgi:hypothetical protein
MGLYAEVLTVTNRGAQGLQVASEAVGMATRYAGASSPVALQNRMFLADAQFATGDLKAARAGSMAAYESARAQFGPNHLATLRVQATVANLRFAAGDAAGARAQLVAIATQLRDLGGRADSALAQVLQYVGEIDLATGKPGDAIGSLQEAIAVLSRFAESGWNVALARERLGEALIAAKRPGAADVLNQAVGVLSTELGEEHPETIRARSALQKI